jgi:hypothetical protein
MPIQMSEEERKRFLAYLESRGGGNPSVNSSTSNQSDNLFSVCVDDIILQLKNVEGLNSLIKAKASTGEYRQLLFNELFEETMSELTNPVSTLLDFRFIMSWDKAETSDELEKLLEMESEINPYFTHNLYRTFIQKYIQKCAQLQLTFNQEILTVYLAV